MKVSLLQLSKTNIIKNWTTLHTYQTVWVYIHTYSYLRNIYTVNYVIYRTPKIWRKKTVYVAHMVATLMLTPHNLPVRLKWPTFWVSWISIGMYIKVHQNQVSDGKCNVSRWTHMHSAIQFQWKCTEIYVSIFVQSRLLFVEYEYVKPICNDKISYIDREYNILIYERSK